MPLTIELSEELAEQVETITSQRGEDISQFVKAAIINAIASARPPLDLTPLPEGESLYDRMKPHIGKIHGGGTAWSEIEAPCDPH